MCIEKKIHRSFYTLFRKTFPEVGFETEYFTKNENANIF